MSDVFFIERAVRQLRPNAQWNIDGIAVTWTNLNGETAPTQAEIETLANQLKVNYVPRKPRALLAVVQSIRDWIAAGADAAERQQRLTRVATVGLAASLIANPKLKDLLAIPIDGDEVAT